MRSTFKILFYLKKNAPKPDGSIPIMCRISIDGSIAQFKACSSGVLHTNPISSYKAKHIQKDRGFLNNEELQLIMNVKFKKASHELIRDLFIFSVFTCLSYIDVKNLTPDKIRKSFDGHIWIETKRQKTNTPSNVRLLKFQNVYWKSIKAYQEMGKSFLFRAIGNAIIF